MGKTTIQDYTDLTTRTLCRIWHIFGVLSATYFPEKDMPKDFYRNSFFNTPEVFRGGSGVISPAGKYITESVYDEEVIIYGDIDLAEIDISCFPNNMIGNYARWDQFSLNVQ